MSNLDTQALEDELRQFKEEKEQIRNLIGRIGGAQESRGGKIFNISLIIIISALFIQSTCHYLLGMKIPIHPQFSVEIGLLLVSIKIILMMHKQTKLEHFQFWILNSIEFRLNDISKRVRTIEKEVTEKDSQ